MVGELGSHRRQTVEAIVGIFHRLAADGYENLATLGQLETADFFICGS